MPRWSCSHIALSIRSTKIPRITTALARLVGSPSPPIAVGRGGYSRAITIHPDGVDVGLLPAPAPQTGAVLSELHAVAAEAAPFKQLDAVVLPVHAHRSAGAHAVATAVPALPVRVLAVLQHKLLPVQLGVVEADPGPALHADGVDAVGEASLLEAAAGAAHLQLPA